MNEPAEQEQNRNEAQAIWEELEKEDEAIAAGDIPAPVRGEPEPAPESVAPQPEPTKAATSPLSDEDRALLKQIPEVMQLVKSTVGRVGSLQSELAKLGKAAAANQGSGEVKPTAGQIDKAAVSPEKWEALKKDFPDWAEGVEAYVATRVPSAQPTQRIDVDKEVSVRLEKARQEDALEIVGLFDEHWKAKAATQEFAAWIQKQPVEYQQRALSTWKPSEILKTMRDYDKHVESSKSGNQPRTNSRLAAAAIPRATSKVNIQKPLDEMSKEEYWAYLDQQDAKQRA